MSTSRMGWGAAVAWAVCAAVSTPAVAGGPLDEPVYRAVVVSGADATENAHEGYLGVYYAFNRDLDREGFVLRLFGTRGFYDYNVGLTAHDARYWQGDVMIGYQWVRGSVDVGLYVGVDHQDHEISPPDNTNELRGSETGFKVAFDLESNGRGHSPLYVALNGSYSTAFDTYYAQGRVGRSFGRFTIGPEAWVLGDVSGDAQRLGAFVSFDVPLGHTTGTLSFSVGHQFGDDTDARKGFDDGIYGTVGFRVPLR